MNALYLEAHVSDAHPVAEVGQQRSAAVGQKHPLVWD